MRENQSKSSDPRCFGRDKNASRKEEEKDVPLGDIAEDVSSYFKKFPQFKKYEKDIKKKYQKYYHEPLPECWPVKFINRAWRKTETMYTFSGRRKCWSLAILFQVMKRSRGYDENEREAQSDVKKESQQSGGDPSANEPVYIRIPFSEMINGKECYRSDTVAEDKENKPSEIDAEDKESKTSETDEKDITESPQTNTYKLIDKVPSPTQILQNQFYITLYNNQTRNAAWVYEILNKSTLAYDKADDKADNKVTQRKPFKKDKSVHEEFQAADGEKPYSGTGYDRGHLAAAANHRWCQQALDDTYLLSNAVPQQSNFNRGIWQTLEKLCREIAEEDEVRNVHVYTGPLYLSSDMKSVGNNDEKKSKEVLNKVCYDEKNNPTKRKMPKENIHANESEKDNKDINKSKTRVVYEFVGEKAVPTHLFKVIIVEKKNGEVLAPECYKIPNESPDSTKKDVENKRLKTSTIDKYRSKLKTYTEKIEDIQRDSGLIFEESKIKEEIMDETWKVQWRAKERVIWREVKVSGSYADHSDRAVLH